MLAKEVPSRRNHFLMRCFVSPHSALRPEGLHHTRGVAGSGFRPLPNIPHCCLRRSLARVPVPVWLIILSDQLPVLALVSRYLTNKLMGRRLILWWRFEAPFTTFTVVSVVICGISIPFGMLSPA